MSAAVAGRSTGDVFDWIVPNFALQGISDRAAFGYARHRDGATWGKVSAFFAGKPSCSRLRSWWDFECGYQKLAQTCLNSDHISRCALPTFDLRKGSLNQAAFGFALFVRDVCRGDLVTWIDGRLAEADPGQDVAGRTNLMRAALVESLVCIPGTGQNYG